MPGTNSSSWRTMCFSVLKYCVYVCAVPVGDGGEGGGGGGGIVDGYMWES